MTYIKLIESLCSVVRCKGACRSGSVSSNQSSEESSDEIIPAHYPPLPIATKDSPNQRELATIIIIKLR